MGLTRVCQELLKSARLAFVKQEWGKAVEDYEAVLNEIRDTDIELDLVMAPIYISYAFCLLRQIANKEVNTNKSEEEGNGDSGEQDHDEAGPSDAPGPSTSAGPSSSSGNNGDEAEDDEDELSELEEPAKSLMQAWEMLLLAKSIFDRFPAKANKLEELHAMTLQAEILFHNNDTQCIVYLDKIIQELKNFPGLVVWPLKIHITKAAYLIRFEDDAEFAKNLNIISGRTEDAMSEVQQPEGNKLQDLIEQVKLDFKALQEAEKAEARGAKPKQNTDDVLELNARELRAKIESKLLALCSPYSLPQDDSGTPLSTRIIEDVNEIMAEEFAESATSSKPKIVESEQIGFGPPSGSSSSDSGSSSLAVKRKAPNPPPTPEKDKKRVLLKAVTNGGTSVNGNGLKHDSDEEADN
ncbi:uncharacterized protein LOC132196397 [Neocloeon triangulifer]|uniref:uncharacterized protein LOC132196397 n=1 Tax=Neocloeon triangulifer TaxID=2078957 RepID=UPI00286EF890|nr:uncharacterized protein LOC132196397 [Neocloeon triangulifer]